MSAENKTDQQKCKSILDLPEIRFAGFLDYMGTNSNLFPEYSQNTGGDVYPDSDATFNGWVL